jgi:hypothetical protein
MARAKKSFPITDPTGERATRRKSAKTENDFSPIETLKDTLKTATNVVQGVAASAESVKANLNGIGQTFRGNHQLTKTSSGLTFEQAENLATNYGIADINIAEMMGKNHYEADANIPEQSAKEANQHKLKIQRQNNALSVRQEKIKQGRLIIQTATENRKLIGDVVKFATAGVETATNLIDHQIAETQFEIRQSKLLQTEEYLQQQQLATQGTINLTPGIREEWELKFEIQETRNQALRLEVEGAIKRNDIKLQEIEAILLESA